MNEENTISANADRDSSNRTYNAARAEWHRHRAEVATDSSTRMLHERFVALYRARVESDHTSHRNGSEI